jgi:Bacterial TSP3 repeat
MHTPPDLDCAVSISPTRRWLHRYSKEFHKAAALCALLNWALLPIRASAAEEWPLVTNPPLTGTYYSLTLFQPPFPFNPFPELPVYALTNSVYVYDDRTVDYVALRAQLAANEMSQFSLGGGGAQTMSVPLPPGCCDGGGGGGGGVSNPPPYSVPGLKVTIPVVTNTDLYVTIFEHNPALPYDIYQKLDLNLPIWSLSATGVVSQTNFYIANTFTNQVYFAAGLAADLDADGIKDGEEALIWKTNPLLADTDGDGLSDGYELFVSFTDPFTPGPVPTLSGRMISKCPVP